MATTNIILFLSIVNFILTLFVFINAKKSKRHVSFLVFSLITTIWLFDNFLLRIYAYNTYGPLSYGLGILVATSALVWVYNLVEEKIPRLIFYFVMPFSLLVFFVSSFSTYVVSPFAISEPLGYTGHKGILFAEYSLYIGLLIIISLYKLAAKAVKETDNFRKKQFFSIFFGAATFGLFSFIVDFFLPLFFNNFKFADLVSITYTPLLLFIVYSIMKHQLFGIKIFMTQFLVALFLSLLFLNFIFSSAFEQYIWNGFIFIISAFLSYLIVKSMFKEIEFDKRLLRETQKNLDFEKRLRATFAEIVEEQTKKIEKIISEKNKKGNNG